MTDRNFFLRDATSVASDLLGMTLVRTLDDGSELRLRITETEAYCGVNDTACHASRGRSRRSEMLYHDGGTIFVYLCYGMHWLMNLVCGEVDDPQGVLIRACEGYVGPGRLTKKLQIDKSFNGQSILCFPALRLEGEPGKVNITLDKRVGINYADQRDIDRLWRYKVSV